MTPAGGDAGDVDIGQKQDSKAQSDRSAAGAGMSIPVFPQIVEGNLTVCS